jgi:hypothetical protein
VESDYAVAKSQVINEDEQVDGKDSVDDKKE